MFFFGVECVGGEKRKGRGEREESFGIGGKCAVVVIKSVFWSVSFSGAAVGPRTGASGQKKKLGRETAGNLSEIVRESAEKKEVPQY